jgi:hypothetical protein
MEETGCHNVVLVCMFCTKEARSSNSLEAKYPGSQIFFLVAASRLAMEPTQSLLSIGYWGHFHSWVKQTGHALYSSAVSSAKV